MFLIKHFVKYTIHLGQKINKWNPRTSYFLLGIRNKIFIIDLEQTLIMIKRALTFIKQVCLNRGYIFYIPPTILENLKNFKIKKKKLNNIVYPLIKENYSNLYINTKILNKNIENINNNLKLKEFNNFTQINNLIFLSHEYFYSFKQRKMLYALIQKRKYLGLNPLTKNHNINSIQDIIISNNIINKIFNNKINLNINIINYYLKPEILFILQININTILIKEAVKFQIPIIGILNSNSNSYIIQYPIPGNDNNNEAFNLYTKLLINTIIDIKKIEIKNMIN